MHPNSLKHLRPWAPGQSGNPSGRPRDHSLIAYVIRNTEGGHELAEILLSIARNPRVKSADRIAAVNVLLDRVYGRVTLANRAVLDDDDTAPVQRVSFHVTVGPPERGCKAAEAQATPAVEDTQEATGAVSAIEAGIDDAHNTIEALDGDTDRTEY
jgi:hypothetical protein